MKTNYAKFSNQQPKEEVVEVNEVVTEIVEEENTVEAEPVVVEAEPVEEIVEEEFVHPTPIMGAVKKDVSKLNVRKNPNANAPVVCTIAGGSTVVITEEESTQEFYKVCTEAGVEGYCMKKFIAVK